MPKLVRDLSKARTDVLFEVYDGPMPEFDRWYTGKITKCYLSESAAGNMMFNVSATLETKSDPDTSKRKYHGWFGRGRIMLLDNELAQQRENQFYEAVSGKAKVDVLYDDIDGSDTSGTVKKIGGANPVGKLVKVLIRKDNREDYDNGVIDRIIPVGSIPMSTDAEDEEADAEADEEIEEDEIPDYESMSLREVRALCDSLKLTPASRSKADILAALEEYYNGDDEDEDEDEEDEDEDEEEIDYSTLSLADLRAELKARGLAIPRGAKVPALVALLEENDAEDEDEDEDEEDEESEEDEEDEDDEDDEEDEDEPETLTTEEAQAMTLMNLSNFAAKVGVLTAKNGVGMTKVKLLRLLKSKSFINDEPPF